MNVVPGQLYKIDLGFSSLFLYVISVRRARWEEPYKFDDTVIDFVCLGVNEPVGLSWYEKSTFMWYVSSNGKLVC